jgi:MarR family transcriptional regulator, organic hydroperoxide resistance regulator
VPDLPALFSDLVRFENQLANAVEGRLRADCQLTLSKFDVLRVLGQGAPCRVNDIADELGITWGGTSKIVDRLEAAGLCRRRSNPSDRRSSLIDLTPAGTRLLAKAKRTVEAELQARIGPSLGDPALERFASTLATLRHAADGRDAPVRAG